MTVNPGMQVRLNQLTALERLDMSRNRLGTLDVSALRALQSLNVSATAIVEWPSGVLDLPHLQHLSLGRSGITTVPEVVQPHQVRLVATANLRGCPLTDTAFVRRDEIITRFRAGQGRQRMPTCYRHEQIGVKGNITQRLTTSFAPRACYLSFHPSRLRVSRH